MRPLRGQEQEHTSRESIYGILYCLHKALITLIAVEKLMHNPIPKLLAVSLSLFLLQGCGGTKLEAIPANGIILAFGDSLTAGYGVEKAQSYPTVLAELSDRTVINAGISGETTAEGLARLPSVLDQTNPDLMILLEGGNDILRSQDLSQTEANLAAMIELAQNRDVEVVLVGVPYRLAKVAPFYRDLAKEYDLAFAPELIGTLLREESYKSDEVHFNVQGYRLVAEELHGLLDKAGAL